MIGFPRVEKSSAPHHDLVRGRDKVSREPLTLRHDVLFWHKNRPRQYLPFFDWPMLSEFQLFSSKGSCLWIPCLQVPPKNQRNARACLFCGFRLSR